MQLTIYSLKGIQFDSDILSLNIKTTSGEITVMDNHLPLVTVLKKGTAVIGDTLGRQTNLDINSGYLEVEKGNRASILMD